MRVESVGKKRKGVAAAAGFTITELLVVMAIIGVLAAIVFPVIIKSKESAKVAQCISNLKQLGGGLLLYIGDYDYRLPTAVSGGAPSYWSKPENGSQKTIQELLYKYVRNGMHPIGGGLYASPGVFYCPSDVGMPGKEYVNGVPPNKPIWRYTGCSYEYYASNQVDWTDYDPDKPGALQAMSWTGLSPEVVRGGKLRRIGAPLNSIFSTTRKAVMGDTWYWHMGDQVPDGRLAYRNTLFADGHAARVNGTDHEEARLQRLSPWHTLSEVPEE
jgi:prepilin-type N-terminal cleavage/methylation domain-containing protein/prepilin-type processing-associated H-X9-DG protein